MKLESNSIQDQQFVDRKYSAYGANISPHLKWSDIPEGTKSFAIYMYDPDAPIPLGFWHWQIVNIDKSITEIPEGASTNLPFPALEKHNDADQVGYYGPQPPKGHGTHRYIFHVLALDIDKIDVKPETSRAYTSFLIWPHVIAEATLIAKAKEE